MMYCVCVCKVGGSEARSVHLRGQGAVTGQGGRTARSRGQHGEGTDRPPNRQREHRRSLHVYRRNRQRGGTDAASSRRSLAQRARKCCQQLFSEYNCSGRCPSSHHITEQASLQRVRSGAHCGS